MEICASRKQHPQGLVNDRKRAEYKARRVNTTMRPFIVEEGHVEIETVRRVLDTGSGSSFGKP